MIKPPIVILESYDISVYPSIENAEGLLEVVDVKNGIYRAYDSEGYLLDLSVKIIEKKRRFVFFKWIENQEVVIISPHQPEDDRSSELKGILIRNLISRGTPEEELKSESIIELINRKGKYLPWSLKTY